jgi:hypothetical protein
MKISHLKEKFKFFALILTGFGLGIIACDIAISAISSGEIKLPRSKIIVTPTRGAGFYFFSLGLNLLGGIGFLTGSILIAWRYLRSSPDQRIKMLDIQPPSSKKPRRILRSLFLWKV